MGWRFRNPFKKASPHIGDDDPHAMPLIGAAGSQGFGAPLAIHYAKRALPPVDNAASYAYQTYLSPVWTPIGGGIPNKRDIGTGAPSYALQGVLVQPVTANGILAGSFVSGPLTNVDTDVSPMPVPSAFSNFRIPAG